MSAVRFFVSRISGKRTRLRSRSRHRASALVETALCLTLVILPTSIGILQYGIVMSASNQIEQVAREAGRFAAVHCLEPTFDGNENQASPPSLRYYLKNTAMKSKATVLWIEIDGIVDRSPTAPYPVLPEGSVQVTPAAVADRVSGQGVTVKIAYPMKRKLFVGTIVPGISKLANDYNATSSFIIE
jgi:hypothetical protein